MHTFVQHNIGQETKTLQSFLDGPLPTLVYVPGDGATSLNDVWLLSNPTTIILIASKTRKDRIGFQVPQCNFSTTPIFKEFKGTITLSS